MRLFEFITEQKSITQHTEGGSLEGYVMSTDKPNIGNYLQSQGATPELINNITKRYKTLALIRNMYVDDDYRGQGIGNELVSNAIDAAANNDADAIILVSDTDEDNPFDLTEWYEGFGFEVIGTAGNNPVMILDL